MLGDHPRSRGENLRFEGCDLRAQWIIPAHAGKTPCRKAKSLRKRDHPRSRGENLRCVSFTVFFVGIIPAHAGKTFGSNHSEFPNRDHPRSRGENPHAAGGKRTVPGSSPLTRGKPGWSLRVCLFRGIIPAHAGKTTRRQVGCRERRDHPRSRGENEFYAYVKAGEQGSSPLTRGKLHHCPLEQLETGIIPAHAGKTWNSPRALSRPWDHPRSRGENYGPGLGLVDEPGSSPLTRGKLSSFPRPSTPDRIIPAHAGKTIFPSTWTGVLQDHPRSRGENAPMAPRASAPAGSSPLTRGKRVHGTHGRAHARIIPAHAGKTLRQSAGRLQSPDHPRSRGENATNQPRFTSVSGSSPLTRGKRQRGRRAARPRRIIPAHAGKTPMRF